MAKKKIILFDLDGTLIDSADAICESFCIACKQNGLEIPAIEKIKETIGHTLEDMFLGFGIHSRDIAICIKAYREHYRKICLHKTKMLPNATKSIQLAYEFGRLGVVTTKTARYSKEILEYFGLLDYFETIIGIEDVRFPKPHQEPVLKAISRIDSCISLDKVFMIGDTILDIQAAIHAGVYPIAVKSGYGKVQDLSRVCEDVFDDSYEAIKFIKNL